MGGAALGALQGLRALGKGSLPKKTEKTVAAARELNGFLKGFVEQVGENDRWKSASAKRSAWQIKVEFFVNHFYQGTPDALPWLDYNRTFFMIFFQRT